MSAYQSGLWPLRVVNEPTILVRGGDRVPCQQRRGRIGRDLRTGIGKQVLCRAAVRTNSKASDYVHDASLLSPRREWSAEKLGRLIAAAIGYANAYNSQRRLTNTPMRNATAAVTPIACQGFSRT